MRHGLCLVSLLILFPILSEAQTARSFDVSGIPDTSEARVRYMTSVITANWNSAVRFPTTCFPTKSGRAQISIDRQEEFFYVRFLLERDGTFPLYAPGNAIIQRNYQRNGDLIQARLFLLDDPSTYIRLYPNYERTKADIVIFGAVLKRGLVLPQIFYYQLREPISRIVSITERSFDWSVLYRAPGPESRPLRFIRAVREGRAYGDGGRLLSALSSSGTPETFLAAYSGHPGTEEITESPHIPFSSQREFAGADEYETFPAYQPGTGVPLPAAAALAHAQILKDEDAMIAAFVRDGDENRRVLLIGGFDESGVFQLEAYDPSSRTFVDWPGFVAEHRDAVVRLVRVPALDV